jgi:hypothetical protein
MKSPRTFCFLFLAALGLVGAVHGAEGEVVVSPAKRQEVLNLAKGLLSTKNAATVGRDPFHSEAYAESMAGTTHPTEGQTTPTADPSSVKTSATRTPRELLQAIATSPSLKPSGYFVLGGQPTLVFGQKRVKAGSFLTITFEGSEYALEIVSIDRPNFTLRLNREEFTRPIK